MTHSNPNDTIQTQEPETSRVPASSAEPIDKDEEGANEPFKGETAASQVGTTESSLNGELADDGLDEDVDGSEEDDAASTNPSASTADDSPPAQTASTPPAKPDQDEDERRTSPPLSADGPRRVESHREHGAGLYAECAGYGVMEGEPRAVSHCQTWDSAAADQRRNV